MDVGDLLRDHAAPRQRVVDDHMFTVESGFGTPATLRLQVFTAPGRRPVMVATQTTSEGPSLTNAAEGYLSAAWRRHCPDDDQPPIWIQRQILPSGHFDYFQLVTFEQATPYTVARPHWSNLADDQITRLVGYPVDPARGEGYVARPPAPEPQLRYQIMWVIRLPRPHPFRQDDCMPTGTPWSRRLGRQLIPDHTNRDCCWYHGGNWQSATRAAIAFLRQAQRAGIPSDDIADHVNTLAEEAALPSWEREAIDSLIEPSIAISLLNSGKGYINGQHRSQALLDMGVRRTIVTEWEYPPD